MLEEIAMYEDDPQDLIFDVLGEAIFPDDPLGRATLGRAEVVAATTREQLLAFHAERYFAAEHRHRGRGQRRARADRRLGGGGAAANGAGRRLPQPGPAPARWAAGTQLSRARHRAVPR